MSEADLELFLLRIALPAGATRVYVKRLNARRADPRAARVVSNRRTGTVAGPSHGAATPDARPVASRRHRHAQRAAYLSQPDPRDAIRLRDLLHGLRPNLHGLRPN